MTTDHQKMSDYAKMANDRIDEVVERRLIGSQGRIVGDHPFSGSLGEIVRIEATPYGRRPVVKLLGGDMNDHECFLLDSGNWRPIA